MKSPAFILMAAASVAGAAAAHLVAAEATLASRSVTALQAKAPSGTTITGAKVVEAADDQPRHCLVDGKATTPGNQVNFRLGLPEQWNGKFYFVGVGGVGGTIGRLNAGLSRGYAS